MFKTFIFGLLAGIILTGACWFFIGRNDIGSIRQDFDRVNGDFEGVQRNSDTLRTDSDGFAADITGITDKSKLIADRSRRIDEGLTGVDGDVRLITIKVDELEQYNISFIRLGRDLGNITFELRQINKDSGETE